MNLLHVLEGWGKSTGLLEVSPDDMSLSMARLKVCAGCEFAKESSILLLLKGNAEDMAAIKCGKCGCPVNEKSLVAEEQCPEGKW